MGSTKEPSTYETQGSVGKNFSEQSSEWREKARDVGKDVKELGKITKNLASDAVENFRENAAEYYEDGVKHAKNFEKSIEQKIRTHPLQAILIAAGVGVLIGLLNRK